MQDKDKKRKYLTEQQVAEMTGIKLPTLRNHRHMRKGLPYVKFGGAVRYDVNDVEEHMEAHKVHPMH